MLRCMALVRSDVSEELGTSFIRVTRIGKLGTTLTVTSDRRMLRKNTALDSTLNCGQNVEWKILERVDKYLQ
jgi:hypothetical protein